jgi:hypothetical protein
MPRPALQLAVYLSPGASNTLNTTTMTITPKADVSQSAKAIRTSNNVTYYEHAINVSLGNIKQCGLRRELLMW